MIYILLCNLSIIFDCVNEWTNYNNNGKRSLSFILSMYHNVRPFTNKTIIIRTSSQIEWLVYYLSGEFIYWVVSLFIERCVQ